MKFFDFSENKNIKELNEEIGYTDLTKNPTNKKPRYEEKWISNIS